MPRAHLTSYRHGDWINKRNVVWKLDPRTRAGTLNARWVQARLRQIIQRIERTTRKEA